MSKVYVHLYTIMSPNAFANKISHNKQRLFNVYKVYIPYIHILGFSNVCTNHVYLNGVCCQILLADFNFTASEIYISFPGTDI